MSEEKPAAPAEVSEDEAAAGEASATEEQPNAVLILRIEDDAGNISTDAVPLGDVKATEVQTIIELGLSNWRAKLGLDG